jgi:hypothetical protein
MPPAAGTAVAKGVYAEYGRDIVCRRRRSWIRTVLQIKRAADRAVRVDLRSTRLPDDIRMPFNRPGMEAWRKTRRFIIRRRRNRSMWPYRRQLCTGYFNRDFAERRDDSDPFIDFGRSWARARRRNGLLHRDVVGLPT